MAEYVVNRVTRQRRFNQVNNGAIVITDRIIEHRSLAASAPSYARHQLRNVQIDLTTFIDTLNAPNPTNMVQFVRDETGNDTFAAADFIQMRDAAIALRLWCHNFVPVGTDSADLSAVHNLQGVRTELSYSAGERALIVAEYDTFLSNFIFV